MKILAFDTCFNKSYIVLSEDEKILQSKIIESDDKNYHSAYLISVIRDILKNNNLFVKDLGLIGVNIGPGSFTGIRTGVTIARVLCQQFDIKLIGVPSLEILSYLNTGLLHRQETNVCQPLSQTLPLEGGGQGGGEKNNPTLIAGVITTVILDARKNKFYFGEYNNGKVITEPCLKDREELISCLREKSFIISDNSTRAFLNENGIKSFLYEQSDENFGIYLNRIVNDTLKDSKLDYNWANVKPLYIQKPSITKPKEKQNVR